MPGNTDFTAVITRTLQAHGDEIVDGVGGQNALLWLFKSKGNLKVIPGGRTVTFPLIYGVNTSFQSYAKYGTVATPDPDILTRSEYPIRIVGGSIVISWLEEAQNAGDREKLIDYGKEKQTEAIVSFGEAMATQLWTVAPGANDMSSIPQQISDSPSTDTTANVGGVDPASTVTINGVARFPWRNATYTTAVTAFNTASAGLTAMSQILNDAAFGPHGPTVFVTTKAIWQLYDVGQAGNRRYTHADLADAGFQNLDYAGLPLLADQQCRASHMYAINTEGIGLYVLRRGNFAVSPRVQAANQFADNILMYMFGNVGLKDRRTQGVITNITG